MEYNYKAGLNEQNSGGLTDSKKGLVVTKGEGCGRALGEGGRRGFRGMMFSTHGVGHHGENSVAQRRHIVNLESCCTDRQGLHWDMGGDLIIWVNVVTAFFHVKSS